MKFPTRELVILAVFGALWGAVEISLGSLLHVLNIPLSGSVLSAIGLCVALTGRLFVPRRGSTLFIGVIAMLIKLFSLGSVVIGPMVGILAEAIIAEVVLSLFGKPSIVAFLIAGGLGVLWTMIQPFFTGLLIFGQDAASIWNKLLMEGNSVLKLEVSAVLWIVVGLAGLRLIMGGLAGWLAWKVGMLLRTRVGRIPKE
jgi:hypothetical protein